MAVEHAERNSSQLAKGPGYVPKVGMVFAFTGHYHSVRVLARSLELMGLTVVRSEITTPSIMEAATTLASADLCLPLRVYVGHVYHLLQRHPDLDVIVAPNVLSEDQRSSTCAKYRDVGGVAIRSLGGCISYLLQQHKGTWSKRLERLARKDATIAVGTALERLPEFLMPNIHCLDRLEMRNICYDVYADIMRWPRARKALLLLPAGVSKRMDHLEQLEHAVSQAYSEIVDKRIPSLDAMLADPTRPRLAVVGRPYLVHDPVLTCDLKRWFERHGAVVVTAREVPNGYLRRDEVEGYYDSHREGQAFIQYVHDKVDGFICLGCFGCHPDAFQVDYLAQYARSHGVPCWTFRFDESASMSGFHTRFETILAFLEQRRDDRLKGIGSRVELPVITVSGGNHLRSAPPDAARRPVFIWPYMGEIINLGLEEAGYQLGLEEYLVPPAPLTEQVMLLGNDRYTESCSPYAYSTGSFKDTLLRLVESFENQAAQRTPPQPHRIIMIMLHGEGPCTFGWYSLVQRKDIPMEFRERLAAGGHTVEMATAGMDGLADFARQLYEAGKAPRLQPILDFFEHSPEGRSFAHSWRSSLRCLRFLGIIWALARPVWAKLEAAERLRARSLILRAHEVEPGSVTTAYHQALKLLRQQHTVAGIARAEKRGRALLEAVPRDREVKPRVVTVGEIYVALTSFANRGTVESLLAREGIEVVEAITLTGFARHGLRVIGRRALCNLRLARSLLHWLRRRNVHPAREHLRDPLARPFLVHEVGGDGVPTVGGARRYAEQGCDGIVHLLPFKCMPEAIAKDAVKEIAGLYGLRYLALDFNRETDIERLRTEVTTFSALLHAELARKLAGGRIRYRWRRGREIARRRKMGRVLTRAYVRYRRKRHTD